MCRRCGLEVRIENAEFRIDGHDYFIGRQVLPAMTMKIIKDE
jgi:hypothetical protein